jgi:predicted nucleic acid-binding protein
MDVDDADHHACARLLTEVDEELVVPAPVLVELEWLGLSHGVPARDAALGEIAAGTLLVEDLTLEDYARVGDLCARYEDLRLGFVDAAVVSIVERYGERRVATLDHRHFSVIRPRHVRALELLPA